MDNADRIPFPSPPETRAVIGIPGRIAAYAEYDTVEQAINALPIVIRERGPDYRVMRLCEFYAMLGVTDVLRNIRERHESRVVPLLAQMQRHE